MIKIGKFKTEPKLITENMTGWGIQTYGERNDYPQRVDEIVSASATGTACLAIVQKFVGGQGFADERLASAVVNHKRQTADQVLRFAANDFKKFGGFALHVNYNALFEISEIQSIPMEFVRFAALDDNGCTPPRFLVHPDWGMRNLRLRAFYITDAITIDEFNPDPECIKRQIEAAGGLDKWHGQLLYFSNRGHGVYPLPVFDSVLTDMSTEEGVANVLNRNARYNFLPSGMLVDNRIVESEEQEEALAEQFMQFQGDASACRILYTAVKSPDDAPQFIPFEGKNYDKEFTETLTACRDNIGRLFAIPPVLRGEDMGGNFGADIVRNSYNYYNAVTEPDRLLLSEVFRTLTERMHELANCDTTIRPLEYSVQTTLSERLGDKFADFTALLDSSLDCKQKKARAKILFGLSEGEANNLIPLDPIPSHNPNITTDNDSHNQGHQAVPTPRQ